MTDLDQAHARMTAAPEDDAARLGYFASLADTSLYLLLEAEPQGEEIAPRVFALEDGPVVLAFDSAERLAEASGVAVPYALLPGRVVARALAGQGAALGINLGTEAPAFLVPPDALAWLADTLDHAPGQADARPIAIAPPSGLPSDLTEALAAKLARLTGLAEAALLAGVTYEGGRRGHMLAFLGADPADEAALAHAAAEALTFSGVEAGEMDVAFLAPEHAAARALARVALRLDLASPAPRPIAAPIAPGSDPEKPPRLR